MQTALVTGGAGFIGSHLVEGLLERDYRVRVVDNLTTGDRANLSAVWDDPDFAFVERDVRDRESLRDAMADVDAVFHLAAYTSVPGSLEHPGKASDINCAGTANVIETARDAGADSLVLASSAAVYGSDVPVPVSEDEIPEPDSPYASSKLYGEQIAEQIQAASSLETVSLRFFNVFGPRQDPSGDYAAVIPAFIDRMTDGERPIIYGDGEQTRDFVAVSDVVRATISAAESDASGVVCNVASGTRISINELVEVLNDVLETDLEPIYEDARPGDIRHSGAAIETAQSLLGYEPQSELADGLERTVEWFV
jgi:nucleoside-diphosphate-sugar epimerase